MARETHRCPECGAKHMMQNAKGSIRRKIVELRQQHPTWAPSIIAIKANTSPGYVSTVLQKSGLPTKAVYEDE